MYKVGGFLFTFHGAGSGESRKKIPVRQRAGNIMSQIFPTALETYLLSLAVSDIAMKSNYLISFGLQLLVSALFSAFL